MELIFPTIQVPSGWSWRAALRSDPRFAEDQLRRTLVTLLIYFPNESASNGRRTNGGTGMGRCPSLCSLPVV